MNEKLFFETTNLVYTELGKFNVEFERITHCFKNCIKHILLIKGLKERIYADFFTEKLTAEPIKSIFQSTMNYYFQNENDRSKLKKLLSLFSDLIEIRNILIHCYWAIGIIHGKKVEPYILGMKTRLSKNGTSLYNLELELKELLSLNKKLDSFNILMYEFSKHIKKKKNNLNKFDFSELDKLNLTNELKKIKSEININCK